MDAPTNGISFVNMEMVIISLLLLAAISAIFLKKIRFPYTIGLVIIGIGLGILASHFEFLHPVKQVKLTPDLILYILLPTLIFEASVNINSRLLIKNIVPVIVLAAPGLLISTLIVGACVGWMTPLAMGGAMLFGAMISATDPVAVIALFKEIGAPKRLTMLVDGESLFNDATAIVMFTVIMAMVTSQAKVSGMERLLGATGQFIYIFLGGLIIGILIGYIMVRIIAFADNNPLVEVALSTVVAYTAFIVAQEFLGVSGVMSVMGAGIVVGWFGSTRFTPEVKEYLEQFWEFAAFVANSFIFLMLGLTETKLLLDLRYSVVLIPVAVAVGATLISRAVVVFGMVPVLGKIRKNDKISWGYQIVMFWGGLRGAVPMALALGLASDFHNRTLIIQLTLGVVLFTLLVQGTTMSWLIKKLKLNQPNVFEQLSQLHGRIEIYMTALGRIEALAESGSFPKETAEKFSDSYKKKIEDINAELSRMAKTPEVTKDTIRCLVWNQAISVESKTYRMLFEQGAISETVFREFDMGTTLRSDAVMKGRFPEGSSVRGLPPEMRVEKMIFRILMKFMGDLKLFQRHTLRNIAVKYEESSSMISASRRVCAALERLEDLYPHQAGIIGECMEYYKETGKAAMRRLERLKEEMPEEYTKVKEDTIYRAVLDAELDAVHMLASDGELPEIVAVEIENEINDAIAASEKNRYPDLIIKNIR